MKTMHISWWWGRKDESTGRPILLARSAYIIGQGLRFTFRVVEKYHFYLVSLYKAIRVYFNAYTVHPAVNSFIMILAKQRFSKPSNRAMFFEHPITPQKITLRPTETIFFQHLLSFVDSTKLNISKKWGNMFISNLRFPFPSFFFLNVIIFL